MAYIPSFRLDVHKSKQVATLRDTGYVETALFFLIHKYLLLTKVEKSLRLNLTKVIPVYSTYRLCFDK